jgi:hypothetical protein
LKWGYIEARKARKINGANGMLALILREYRDEAMLNIPPNIQAHAKSTNQSEKTGAQIVITQNNFKSPGPTRSLKIICMMISESAARLTSIKKIKPRNFILKIIENIAKRARFLLLIIRWLISLFEIMRAKLR